MLCARPQYGNSVDHRRECPGRTNIKRRMRVVCHKLRHRYHARVGDYHHLPRLAGQAGQSFQLDGIDEFGRIYRSRGHVSLGMANVGVDRYIIIMQGIHMSIHVDIGRSVGVYGQNTIRSTTVEHTFRVVIRYDILPGSAKCGILLDNRLIS